MGFRESDNDSETAVSAGAGDRPGGGFRKAILAFLVIATLSYTYVPALAWVGAVFLLGGVLLLMASTSFLDKPLGFALGVWPDRPKRGRLKLAFFLFYGLILLALAYQGDELVAQRREGKAQEEREAAALVRARADATSHVSTLLEQSRAALREGDIDAAAELATGAAGTALATNASSAHNLLRRIKLSDDPALLRARLVALSDEAFEGFLNGGSLPFDLGFEVLNERAMPVARSVLPEASAARDAQRQADEAERKAKLEVQKIRAEAARVLRKQVAENRRAAQQKDAEQKAAAVESSRRAVQSRRDAYVAALVAADVSVVTGVRVRKIGSDIWEATLTVSNLWHVRHEQVRLQDAQALWAVWAKIASPAKTDSARIKLVDGMGNEVGGSRLLGGSLIWVDD